MNRILCPLFVVTFLLSPAIAKEQAAQSIADHLQEVADARWAVAEAKHDLQKRRLDALTTLFAEGNASYREVTLAKLDFADATESLASAKKLSGFVAKAAAASDKANRHQSGSQKIATIIQIPSLATDAHLHLLSTLPVPASAEWDGADLQTALEHSCSQHGKSSTEAWEAMIDRLTAAQASLSKPSVAIENELKVARLEMVAAIAEQKLAKAKGKIVLTVLETNPFEFEGHSIDSSAALLRVAQRKADQLQFLAIRESAEQKKTLIDDWASRVAKAAAKGASPSSELPMLEHYSAQTQAQAAFAAHSLGSFESNRSQLSSPDTTLVSLPNRIKNTELGLSGARVQVMLDSAMDRVLFAAESLENAEQHLRAMKDKLLKLEKLAKKDSFFQREVERTRNQVSLAAAAHTDSQVQHQMRILEHQYVQLRLGGEPMSAWMKPVAEYFSLIARSDAQEKLAFAQLNDADWRLDATTQLHEIGAATWKETITAKVNCDRSAESHERIMETRKLAAAVAQLLADVAGREIAHVVQ